MTHPHATWLVLLAALVVGVVLSVCLGAVWITPADALAALTGAHDGVPWQRAVITDLRLPRALLAAVGGAGLAAAGVGMQGIFRNPMADPGVLGVSAGAALGAVSALYGLTLVPGAYAAPVGAFLGATATAATVLVLADRAGARGTETLLLAGIAVSGVASALTALVLSLALAEWELGREMVAWLMGGLDRASWAELAFLVLPVAVGSAGIAMEARPLDVLATGEETASALGVDVARLTKRVLVFASLATAATVSVMGVVAFVGLIVPHVVRRLAGPQHGRLVPLSALAGAVTLVFADLLCRLEPTSHLRLGVVTSLLGGPFFLVLLFQGARRRAGAP